MFAIGFKDQSMSIFLESQAVIKALSAQELTISLVCYEVRLMWAGTLALSGLFELVVMRLMMTYLLTEGSWHCLHKSITVLWNIKVGCKSVHIRLDEDRAHCKAERRCCVISSNPKASKDDFVL